MEKAKKFLYLMLVALVCCPSFFACNEDDDDNEKKEDWRDEVILGDSMIISAKEMCDLLFGPDGGNADEDNAELRDAFMKNVKQIEDSLNNVHGSNGLYLGFEAWEYYYWSKDQHGNDIRLSSLVSWAKYWLFGWYDLDPNNIYLVEHYTVLSNDECPTNSYSKEQIALGDNLLIIPDYIGYGYTKEKLHPYLNHDVCALNSVDALARGYKVFEEERDEDTRMEDDWKMYVIGSSQGGSNALAVHKYLDTHPEIAHKWRFDYSYCCAGPYSPRKTMDYYYSTDKLTYPVIIPIVIKSMLDSYPEIMGKWKEEDFYSEKYLAIKDDMDRLIAAKQTPSKPLIDSLKVLLKNTTDCTISVNDLLSDSALCKTSEMTRALYACLDKNDLTTGWTPTHLIKLYHSKEDDIVPFSNAEAVVSAFGDNVSLFRSYWVGHVATCTKWYGTLLTNNW